MTKGLPPIVDSHCHLNHEDLIGNHAVLVARARDHGVCGLLVVGCDIESSRDAVRIAGQHRGAYAACGIHPHEAHSFSSDAESALADMLDVPVVVALGEIGLDYHYNLSPPADQRRAFARQLELAASRDMPVVVHCRDAYDDLLDALSGIRRGVLHCWTGSPAQAEAAVGLGFCVGFTGIVTFKNADQVRDSARVVPDDRILVETDAPYLAPVPHRGRPNEPAFLPLVVRALAAARGADPADIAASTTRNAARLFEVAWD